MHLTRDDAARALVAYHFRPRVGIRDVFRQLVSVQFDPLAPIGCNHDLVLFARTKNYRIGNWKELAYQSREIYDGWDKQASLIQFEAYQSRRIFHEWQGDWLARMEHDHPHAVEAVLAELAERGPLLPRDFTFQERKPEWQGTWYGPNVTKQALRALWHAGKVMTSSRVGHHHVYDLTERVLPVELHGDQRLSKFDSVKQILLDRHYTMGMIRPTAALEVWSMYPRDRKDEMAALVNEGALLPAEVDGVKVHLHPGFVEFLDKTSKQEVRFVAPLDPFIWDRKMIKHVFNFDYLWEVYVPECKRRFGYYMLPIVYGSKLVGRVEFFARNGEIETRKLMFEEGFKRSSAFDDAYEREFAKLREYASPRE